MSEAWSELKKDLTAATEDLARQKKLTAMLRSLESEAAALTQKESQLRNLLSQENADVARLEKTSAASLLFSLLGTRAEKLEKEQREAYTARLQYDAVQRQLDDCQARLEAAARELETLSGCKKRYEQAFLRIQQLLSQDPRYAQTLCELERRRSEALGQLREIDEAIAAGNACLGQIAAIESSLDSAGGWGAFDLLGGGLLADLAKHSHLDEAQAGVEYLQTLLSRFHTELADVKIDSQVGQVNVDGFMLFADYFFDGLIMDWAVLDHIHNSQESVIRVREQVTSVLRQLDAVRTDHDARRAALSQEIAALVRNA